MTSNLEAKNLALGYGTKQPVLENLQLAVERGKITALVGPNGCGKSTLLRGLARVLKPLSGTVELEGKPLDSMDTIDIARKIGMLPQSPIAPEGITVRQLVLLGRYPHRRWWQAPTPEDFRSAETAMAQAEVQEWSERPVASLSGGQRQRVWIAMALAQETSTLLLDEPTTFLDLAHQMEVLHLVQKLNQQTGATVVMVLHDLNHAARFSDVMVMMKNGRIVAHGKPEEIINAGSLREVFGVECSIMNDPVTRKPFCIPLRSI